MRSTTRGDRVTWIVCWWWKATWTSWGSPRRASGIPLQPSAQPRPVTTSNGCSTRSPRSCSVSTGTLPATTRRGKRFSWRCPRWRTVVRRFLFLPDGEDPDSLVRAEGAEGFNARLDQATPLADVLFDHLSQGKSLRDPAARAALAKDAAALRGHAANRSLPGTLWRRLGEQTGLEPEHLTQLYWTRSRPGGPERGPTRPARRRHPAADKVGATLIRYPELVDELHAEHLRRFETSEVTVFISDLAGIILADESTSPRLLLRQITDESQRRWLEVQLQAERLPRRRNACRVSSKRRTARRGDGKL